MTNPQPARPQRLPLATRLPALGAALGAAALGAVLGWGGSHLSTPRTQGAHRALAAGPTHPYTLENAAAIYVTPRGQDYFGHDELRRILSSNQIDLTRKQRDRWEYQASKAFDLGALPRGLRPYQVHLNHFRKALKDWLPDFSFSNPKLDVVARGARYEADDLDLGVRIDARQPEQDGHVLTLIVEARVPHLRVRADDICGHDAANPMLGNCKLNSEVIRDCAARHTADFCNRYSSGFGLYHPWVELADTQALEISLPMHAQIRPDGGLELEALTPTTNLDQLKFASGQDQELLLPVVQVQVGTQSSVVNPAPFEAMLRRLEPELVRLGVHELQEVLLEQLPSMLTEAAIEPLKQSFETVKTIDPPGTGRADSVSLDWGLRPGRLGLEGPRAYVALDGYVADPENPSEPEPAPMPRHEPPVLAGRAATDYDFAFAVSSDVVNRVLKLGYDRGNFERVHSGKDSRGVGQSVRIVDGAPVLTPGPNGRGRLHLTIERSREWSWTSPWESIKETYALKDPYRVTLDVEVSLRPATGDTAAGGPITNAVDLIAERIDPSTAFVVPSSIDHAAGSVAEALQAELAAINGRYAQESTVVGGPFGLPPSVFNLPIRELQAEVDPNGYFIFYMAYGDRAQ